MEVYFTSDSICQHIDMRETQSFSPAPMLSEQYWKINNECMTAQFSDTSCADYKIFKTQIKSTEDCKIETLSSDRSFVCLGIPLLGDVNYHYNKIDDGRLENIWRKGYANVLVSSQCDGHSRLRKNKGLEMLEIMISPQYFEKISMAYPHLFELPCKRLRNGESFFLSPENIPLIPSQYQLLRDIMSAQNMGNIAKMYIEAKVIESLALFMHSMEQKQTVNLFSLSTTDRERMHRVKDIIHDLYKNPPSLRQIALLVETNEHKLKTAFKQEFGNTVFGYLYDYRMSLADQYLKDTCKPIHEIAELVGYEYHAHFSTAYKKKYGVSPKEMRGNL